MHVLYGYSYFRSLVYPDIEEWNRQYFMELNQAGFDVQGFCLTLNPPGPRLTWRELDKRWRWGDRELLRLYERLEQEIEGVDVFLNGSGINLHPEFVARLPCFTVFRCFDDPESSADLSRPVATAYDLCLVGNAAEVDTYRNWGVQHAEWTPMGLMPGSWDQNLTEEKIRNGQRDIDLAMFVDRHSVPRQKRLHHFAQAFPEAHFFGRGWPRGILEPHREDKILSRARIGPNLHNSTGPVNFRLFQLPANGVMQICDNKHHLGKVFELGSEVVGFDSIKEGIDLCRYYLEHEEERCKIAIAGWKRTMSDYTPIAVFSRTIKIIEKYMPAIAKQQPLLSIVKQQRDATRIRSRVSGVYRGLSLEKGTHLLRKIKSRFRFRRFSRHQFHGGTKSDDGEYCNDQLKSKV
jgi:spore maturation protein CgeB